MGKRHDRTNPGRGDAHTIVILQAWPDPKLGLGKVRRGDRYQDTCIGEFIPPVYCRAHRIPGGEGAKRHRCTVIRPRRNRAQER